MVELFLEVAGGGARFDFFRLRDPGEGKADGDPAEHAQHQRGVGVAHPALILLHGDIQCLMESALNNPIAAFEPQEAKSIQLIQGETADEINDFCALLFLAPHSSFEPRNGAGSGKAGLRGSHLAAIKDADFMASPIVFPGVGMGLLRGFWGKNSAVQAELPMF